MTLRELFITLPDWLKLARFRLIDRLDTFVLRLIDRYLLRRDEERTRLLLPFEELPVLYDEDEFPIIDDGFFD